MPFRSKTEVRRSDQAGSCDAAQGLDLVFYGDSITESWRGTEMNNTNFKRPGIADVYRAHFAKYRSIVLAIAGEPFCGSAWANAGLCVT